MVAIEGIESYDFVRVFGVLECSPVVGIMVHKKTQNRFS